MKISPRPIQSRSSSARNHRRMWKCAARRFLVVYPQNPRIPSVGLSSWCDMMELCFPRTHIIPKAVPLVIYLSSILVLDLRELVHVEFWICFLHSCYCFFAVCVRFFRTVHVIRYYLGVLTAVKGLHCTCMIELIRSFLHACYGFS